MCRTSASCSVRSWSRNAAVLFAGDAPPGPQTADVKGLLDDWQSYQDMRIVGRSDPASARHNKALGDNWENYLERLARDKPNLLAVINKVFRDQGQPPVAETSAPVPISALGGP